MVKVVLKRLVREFRQHIFRYIALLVLIMAGVYVIVSMAGAAETIIHGSDSNLETARCEDGEFAVFFPYTTEQEDNLRKDGISLERKFYCDLRLMMIRQAAVVNQLSVL